MKLHTIKEKNYGIAPNKEFAVWGISLEGNEKSQEVTLSIQYLMDAIKCLETRGHKHVTLRVQTDFPILITTEPGKMDGMIISPMVEENKVPRK